MKRAIPVVLAMSLFCLNTALADTKESAHTETSVERASDGTYKSKVTAETVNANGTKTELERTQKAKNKLLGGTEVSTKEEVKTDPKGMLNTTTETREATTSTDRKGNYEHTTSANSVDAQGTAHSKAVTQKISADGKKSSVKETKTDDPKGLLNKKTVETESEVSTK